MVGLVCCVEFVVGCYLVCCFVDWLGIEVMIFLCGGDGFLEWFLGFVGSISYCDDFCVVVVVFEFDYKSFGIDVEFN